MIMTQLGDIYLKAANEAATIAQTKYKNTKLDQPWPEWEKAREIAQKAFINFLRENQWKTS